MSRPEHSAPPEIFYNDSEAKKYSTSSRMMEIQTTMASRALELLMIPPGQSRLLLDIGCGTGLSGSVLSEDGHTWVGMDISESMLNVGLEREDGSFESGDVILSDMGQGVPFRPGTFDGAISISALQWLCNQDKKSHNPKRRTMCFFQTLYNVLSRGSRAVFQFYPENPQQVEMLTTCAMKCGFTGGLVIDYPNSTKAKKFFLCLFAGVPLDQVSLPAGKTDLMSEDNEQDSDEQESGKKQTINYESRRNEKDEKAKQRRNKNGNKKMRVQTKSKQWIVEKKERQRRQGKKVRPDSKYTGVPRKGAF